MVVVFIKTKVTKLKDEKEGSSCFYNGECIEKYENGIKKSKKTYKNGKLDGLSEKWDIDGTIRESINYKNGVKDGRHIMYENDKNLEYTYKNGKVTSAKMINKID